MFVGIPISKSGCANQWIPHRQYCYRQFNITRTWADGGHWCNRYSSTVVTTKTVEEKQLVEYLLKAETSCFYLSHVDFLTNEALKEIFGLVSLSNDVPKKCIYLDRRGSYKLGDCVKECSFMCKKDRGNYVKKWVTIYTFYISILPQPGPTDICRLFFLTLLYLWRLENALLITCNFFLVWGLCVYILCLHFIFLLINYTFHKLFTGVGNDAMNKHEQYTLLLQRFLVLCYIFLCFCLFSCINCRWLISKCSIFVWHSRSFRTSNDWSSGIYYHCTKPTGMYHRMSYLWPYLPLVQFPHHRNPNRTHMRAE